MQDDTSRYHKCRIHDLIVQTTRPERRRARIEMLVRPSSRRLAMVRRLLHRISCLRVLSHLLPPHLPSPPSAAATPVQIDGEVRAWRSE